MHEQQRLHDVPRGKHRIASFAVVYRDQRQAAFQSPDTNLGTVGSARHADDTIIFLATDSRSNLIKETLEFGHPLSLPGAILINQPVELLAVIAHAALLM